MGIISALMSEDHNLRVTNGDRWLVYDIATYKWVVYEHKPYARHSTILIEAHIQDDVIPFLLGDN